MGKPKPGGGGFQGSTHSASGCNTGGYRVSGCNMGGGKPKPGGNGNFGRSGFDAGDALRMAGSFVSRSGYGYHRNYHPPYGRSSYGYGGYGPSYGGGGLFRSVLPMIIILIVLLVGIFGSSSDIVRSTTNREPIAGNGFVMDCIVNEPGYDGMEALAVQGMSDFHMATGIQPYVYLKSYDSSLGTVAAKDAWAEAFFGRLGDEKGFLVVYFEESDGSLGYSTSVSGTEIESVLDSEALQIFWSYWKSNWNAPDKDVMEVIHDSFQDTGERIMTKTTTFWDVAKYVMIVLVILVTAMMAAKILKLRRQHAREEAEETERILRTPLHTSEEDRYMRDED